ncbi:MAG: ABC transporter ATP-binding protein [Clostridia bacterium]|nr:ABC transporter ATP-binding protein [Clostridia bacterium]
MEEKKVMIEIKNLVKTYGEGEALSYALNDVSLKVYEHDFLVILGGSGCGKSTLLNMIGGMDKVDSGSIIVDDEDICKFNDKKLTLYRRDTVGFVYQFFNLINDITIYQNVTLSPSSRQKQRALKLLDRVGLLDKKDKFPRQVSGGQQQRVAIARALNKDSDILLCDEPTGALDDVSGKAVLKLLEDIHSEGKTIILVTHTKEIAQMANRIVTMKGGKIVSDVINENIVKAEEVEW